MRRSIPGFEPVDEGHVAICGVRALDPFAKELLDELEAIMQNRTDRASRTVLIEVDRKTAYKDYIVAVDALNRVKGYVELRVKQ